MKSRIILALAAMVLAGPAVAAEYVCQGQANGEPGEVIATLVVDETRIVRGLMRWAPRRDASSTPNAALILERPYTDVDAGTLGPYSALLSINQAPMNPPRSEVAVVAVSSNVAPSPLIKVWGLYGQAVAQMKAGRGAPGTPAGATPLFFNGSIPFTRQEAPAVALLDSLATSNTIITSVTDPTGQTLIARGLFWVNGRAEAETLGHEALRLAKEAATAPQTRCRANTPPPGGIVVPPVTRPAG